MLARPLGTAAALEVIRRLRSRPHRAVIDYPGSLMDAVWKRAETPGFPARGVFDARLAYTLLYHGVREFATRNTRHFRHVGFEKLVKPID